MDTPEASQKIPGLPDNAYRPLQPGESYEPIVPAAATVPERTLRSVVFGLAMTILFSAAATFVALKLGQGIETAIPIAILAVGLSALVHSFGSALRRCWRTSRSPPSAPPPGSWSAARCS